MRKQFIPLIYVLFLSTIYAKSPAAPAWVKDYSSVFPDSKYLAQRGTGTTAEKAKTEAAGTLSRFIQSTVTASLSTNFTYITNGKAKIKQKIVTDDVKVQSQVDFFGLEYTEPYYVKAEKKWYCVVYMNRETAWRQYKPQIEIKKNSFCGLYKNLEKDNDYFTKLEISKKVWESAEEFLEKLEYGRMIHPQKEAVTYQAERDLISNIPVILEEAKRKSSIFIQVNSDYNRIFETALSSALTNSGFNVCKAETESTHTAELIVDSNISGFEPLSIKPGINLKIRCKDNNKTVFSYETQASEKSLGYKLETAQKKAFPKLAEEIKADLIQKFE